MVGQSDRRRGDLQIRKYSTRRCSRLRKRKKERGGKGLKWTKLNRVNSSPERMNREIDLKWAWEDARGGGFLLLFSAKMFICLSGLDQISLSR